LAWLGFDFEATDQLGESPTKSFGDIIVPDVGILFTKGNKVDSDQEKG